MKKRNLNIQCLATLFFPIGIYAFKRINRLKDGVFAYLLMACLCIILFIGLYSSSFYIDSQLITGLSIIIGVAAIACMTIFPMLCMWKWVINYNKRGTTTIHN